MHENILKYPDISAQTRYQPNRFSYMDFKYQTAFSSNRPSHSPEIQNYQAIRLSASPVLPGTGNTAHNVTGMLGNSEKTADKISTDQSTYKSTVFPYSTAHFMSFRYKALQEYTKSYDADVSHDYTESDTSASDMSISTERSASPSSTVSLSPTNVEVSLLNSTPSSADILSSDNTPSSGDSPSSKDSTESETSDSSRVSDEDTENTKKQPKKSARTNFTKDQVNALIKIFHETPYPDSEMMENIGKDLNIKEKQVKIWFQNKRARWRRRVNDKNNNNIQHFLPTTPMMSPATPFGYIPTGHTMTQTPLRNFHAYNSYPWMLGYAGHNYINQQFTGHNVAANYQTFNEYSASPTLKTAQLDSAMPYPQYGTTPLQQSSPNQNRQFLQNSGYMYVST